MCARRAIACVKERLPGVSATIVGDGVLRRPLEEMARELGLESNVVFTGRRSDVADLLPRARVFVLTSESEGVSLSLMEALACGVPAVAPRVGDLADVIEDCVNGFLIDEHTAEVFAARILELLSDEARRRQFAAEARRTAERYETGVIARRWEDVLGPGTHARTVDSRVAVQI